MEQKIIDKQEILKEIEKVLSLYDNDIVHVGYSINITFKDFGNVEIRKNHYSGFVTPNYCGATTI